MNDPITPPAIEQRHEAITNGVEPAYILMCTHAAFQQHAAVCLASLLTNNPQFHFNIVIVGRMTEQLDEAKLRRSITSFPNHSLEFHKFAPPADLLLPLVSATLYTIDS